MTPIIAAPLCEAIVAVSKAADWSVTDKSLQYCRLFSFCLPDRHLILQEGIMQTLVPERRERAVAVNKSHHFQRQ